MPENTILAIGSDKTIFSKISQVAESNNFQTLQASNLEQIENNLIRFKPNLILLDLNFQQEDVISILSYLKNIECKTQIVLIGIDDKKLLSALKHIAEIDGLKVHKVLTNNFNTADFEFTLRSFADLKSKDIDARQLVHALEKQYFMLQYQPLIEVKTMRLKGFEALIRLKPPYENMIFPIDFIPCSEETGLIVPLTNWLIRNIFANYNTINKIDRDIKIYINLSHVSLNDPVFSEEILKLATTYNIAPKNVCFEITESGIAHQSTSILEVLTRLRIKGFDLAIDDFGTGYSSIVELQSLPFTELKIDRRFVQEIATNESAFIIVRSLIDLGHNLGLSLVAEGVEDKETLQVLQDLGCDLAQGYYFAKPISLEALETWYAEFINEDLIWRVKS